MPNGPYSRPSWNESALPIFPYSTIVRPRSGQTFLIELGAAIGMRKPYFYFNYGKKRTVKINNRHEPISTASDLAGMPYLPYNSYRGLFIEFARRLPGFLVDRAMAR
jgi:hypothetical protein